MKRHSYKKLEIYQRSLRLASEIIKVSDGIRPMRLGDQIAGSCVSIPSNIAEGSERSSQKDFLRFLEYAIGSTAELITQLSIFSLAGRGEKLPLPEWIEETENIYNMIHAFRNRISKDI